MSNEEIIIRANKAKKLKDSLLDDFFVNQQTKLLIEFKNTSLGDSERLVSIHTAFTLIADLESELDATINSGILAKTM